MIYMTRCITGNSPEFHMAALAKKKVDLKFIAIVNSPMVKYLCLFS